jgi:hypothetical protein
VRANTRTDAAKLAGHKPIKCNASWTLDRGSLSRMRYVAMQHARQLKVTEVMRARMTDGASRDRVALGRVHDER